MSKSCAEKRSWEEMGGAGVEERRLALGVASAPLSEVSF